MLVVHPLVVAEITWCRNLWLLGCTSLSKRSVVILFELLSDSVSKDQEPTVLGPGGRGGGGQDIAGRSEQRGMKSESVGAFDASL